MGRLYNESGHASQDDRNQEAERLIDELAVSPMLEDMPFKERQFINDMNRAKQNGSLFCSPKQLFWLRDLYERYCV